MSTFPYTPAPLSHSDSLLTAIFIAAVIHIFLLMGFNFTIPQPQKLRKSIEVTLSSSPAKKAPKSARYLAQDNQLGAGKKNKQPRPPKQKLPSQAIGQRQNAASQPSAHLPIAEQKTITTINSAEKNTAADDPSLPTQSSEAKPLLTAESLQKQIAELGEQIRQTEMSSELSRIKFVNALSAHKYIAGQYIKDWERKVERTGNLNYPEVARKKGFSGTLTMDVGIKADGSIYSMRITKSSGIQALDDAAKRIVRMSAPFAALPAELLQELEVLVITRVWKFSDESGMTTR